MLSAEFDQHFENSPWISFLVLITKHKGFFLIVKKEKVLEEALQDCNHRITGFEYLTDLMIS